MSHSRAAIAACLFWSSYSGLKRPEDYQITWYFQVAGSVQLCTCLHNYAGIFHGQALRSLSGVWPFLITKDEFCMQGEILDKCCSFSGHRIIELVRLEKPSSSSSQTITLAPPRSLLSCVPHCHIHMFSECFQRW